LANADDPCHLGLGGWPVTLLKPDTLGNRAMAQLTSFPSAIMYQLKMYEVTYVVYCLLPVERQKEETAFASGAF
jgi:hypothetical protein